MRASRIWLAALGCAAAVAIVVAPGAARAAQHCSEPGADWTQVSPARAGMDAAKLAEAIDYATANQAAAVRVYRYGCRVASDRLGAVNAHTTFQSWSMAKSITSLIFGRAMTQGLVGPDDPLGSLIPVADQAHGAITMRDLLTQTSGLQWNGLRDYNIFMPDRIAEALTVPVEKRPGTYWEYSQSGPALVAEATQSAVGEGFQAYAHRELLGPLGIEPGTWRWQRDSAGHTQGFFGVHMIPDDFARLGELLRRGGVWRGRRLLSKRFVREAIAPIPQNGYYGYLIWVNASKPCVGPRVIDRPVSDDRDFPSLPADMYQFAGLFGQLVTVFPGEGLIVARFGQDTGSIAGGASWEEEFYRRVLGSITDQTIEMPEPQPDAAEVSREDVDRGFLKAIQHPEQIAGGEFPPALPPAGPARARATLIELRARRPGLRGTVKVRLHCPRNWPSGLPPRCAGKARLTGGSTRAYRVKAGKAKRVRFQLRPGFLRRLDRHRRLDVTVKTRDRDAAGGTAATRTYTLRRR